MYAIKSSHNPRLPGDVVLAVYLTNLTILIPDHIRLATINIIRYTDPTGGIRYAVNLSTRFVFWPPLKKNN